MPKKPRVRNGKVTLTKEQYDLLVCAAAQTDYGVPNGDWDCLDAAAHNAALALASIGEKTAAEEKAEEEAADAALDSEEEQ